MPKAKHDFICDNCGKTATINYQNEYNIYSIKENGNFNQEDTIEGDINEFYCNKCWENR